MPQGLHIILTVNAAWNIANFRMPLIRALLANGHTVTVLAPKDDAVETLRNVGCQWVDLEIDKQGLNPLKDAKLIAEFRKHFKSLKPDIILSFTIKNNVFGALAAKPLRIPFVPNVTGLGTAFLSSGILLRLARGLYRTAFRSLPVVFFQNRDDRDLFVKFGLIAPNQAQLLPGSGIDLSAFSPAPYSDGTGALRYLFVGRIIRDKGVIEFVEAARIVKAERSNIRFQMLGAIGFANRTSIPVQQVQEWQDEGLIEYLGITTDVRVPMADSDCIVLPSYREGAPRTLIEGAALGRPAIATNVPGCNAVVDHGITGLLCAARDSSALACAMLQFGEMSQAERAEMGRKARSKIEKEYSVEHIIAAYRGVIAAMVK
ncbi:glycosyltransferase family 4 protein [Pontixanthobacter sp.]|uniref:glycosyltransferase family 4 protein n=1 Tax=Pontixanthobacter sp. TaxID=2792078 RepID=UPI003C7E0E1B